MVAVTNWHKFKLLLWKNWTLQWSHKVQLVVEILLPALFSLLLVLVRTLVDAESEPQVEFPSLSISNIKLFNETIGLQSALKFPKFELLFSPNTSIFEDIVQDATTALQLPGFKGFATSAELEEELIKGNYLAGVQFANESMYPKRLDFALRFPSELRTATNAISTVTYNWMTNRLYPTYDASGPRNVNETDGGIPVGYLREAFLPIQHAITTAYLKMASGETELPTLVLQRYPYPAYTFDPLLSGLGSLMSLIILLSFIYPCSYITRYITTEKEKQLKEVMKIMGLQNWIHWTAWFVKSFLMLLLSVIIIVLVLKIKWKDDVAVLTNSSFTALMLFMLVYIAVSICFAFMVATFFNKASTAAAVSGLIWFLTYIPYQFTRNSYGQMSLTQKLGWSLISNTAMGYGFNIITEFEGSGEGLQWSNIFRTVSPDDNLTLGHIMIMMLISCVLYMLVCLYVEQILPGDFGVPKKWNYPFSKEFWCSSFQYEGIADASPNGYDTLYDKNAYEAEPMDKQVGVQVRNLRKTFDKKVAVKGLSMNMYEDQITVLLGHNGAGKTTTISMLTGMIPPTSGTAIINGSDIRTNLEGARMSLGLCPQHNVLFDEMSVANHIVFFSRLKGVKDEDIQQEVDRYLKTIELEDKANVASAKLSGGMKRKLSLCCALVGNTKVVLCDEPSSGLDPAARRQLWELLQREKVGRTLLLTTHFMDEADVLGDRIAIMCGGELKCMGSPFFLKKKFGSGYRLICVKREDCDVNKVTDLLNEFIPGIQPESNIGTELTYQLPDKYSSIFEMMFNALEEKSDELNLDGYGVSITSLEEVFMKVGADSGSVKQQLANGSLANNIDEDIEYMQTDGIFHDNARLLKGAELMRNQWHAMFQKKLLYTWRTKLMLFIQNIMPIYFVLVTVLIVRSQGKFLELPPMTMSLAQYPEAVTVLEKDARLIPNSLEDRIAKAYEQSATSFGKKYAFESTGDATFSDYILKLGKTRQVRINSNYLAAATIAPEKITAWLNNQPLHTAPLTVNLIHNAMAKVLLHPDAEISVTNMPLPYTTETQLSRLLSGQNLGTQLATNICFCMCFVSSLYILFVIKERVSRSKLLQFVGGINVWTFWLTQLLWDMATFTATALVLIITVALFQENGFTTFEELARNFFLLILFGFSVLPFTYLFSFRFSEPDIGFARSSIVNIFAGMALFIVITVMAIPEFDTKDTADKLKWIFRIFPHFSLAMSLNNLYINTATRNACSNEIIAGIPDAMRCQFMPMCCDTVPFFGMEEPGILPEVLYLSITAVVFFLMLVAIEYKVLPELLYKLKNHYSSIPQDTQKNELEDADVTAEKTRIFRMTKDEISLKNLVLDRLSKYYGGFPAVKEISLCVKHTECFGLLGVNGAGKTSTFKMLTGDEYISYGSAYVKGISLNTNMNAVYKEIGYCPQFDALLGDLTGREHLQIFCLIRGVKPQYIPRLTEELAKSFGFMKHFDKLSKDYSGGNKRKLSTAIAVIGSPTVIYLDEPTTGMDPAARRQLWNVVCRIRDSGKSLVLTSHSMEECEALCTRLAIMVNGEFQCIGSTQHLKNKFSKGLVLKIKMRWEREDNTTKALIFEESQGSLQRVSTDITAKNSDVSEVKQFIALQFPQATLKEEHQGLLTFYIPLTSIKWSKIFGLLESNREALNIEDYSISQTTLEEIFLEFAKHQKDDTRTKKKKKSDDRS